jgi:hypothetical protein
MSSATGILLIAASFGERFPQQCILCCQYQQQLCWSTIALQQLSHDGHWLIDMEEECFIACAQVIQSRLTSWYLKKRVLGTFTMTGEVHFVLVAGER